MRWASQMVLVIKNLPANAGSLRDMGSIAGLGRSPRGENGNPLLYSCLENLMEREAWLATVHRITQSRTRLKWLSIAVLFKFQLLYCTSIGHLFHFFFHTCSSQDRGVSKEGLKLTLEDLPSYKSLFWGIQHLFVEKGFILLDLPWVQKSRFKHLLIHKRIIPCSSGIYCRDARFLNIHKLITMIHHINSWRLKTIWSSIDSEKVLTKFKCHL